MSTIFRFRIPINGQSADDLRPMNGTVRVPEDGGSWQPQPGDIEGDTEPSGCSPITLEYAEDLLLLAKKVKFLI